MLLLSSIEPFDWQRVLLSEEAPPAYLLEVVFRCFVAYLLTLSVLRLTGRRGVRQLSIFELSIILALGSAAGDAMFYDDVPLLHVAVVFAMVAGLYALFNRLTEKLPRFSDWLEGAPVLLIEEGRVHLPNFQRQNLTQKELFGELRQLQVEHLGQVRRAYIEATGNISAYFYPPDEVQPGLSIWPERLGQERKRIEKTGLHACCRCGYVQHLARGAAAICPECQADAWIPACTALRQSEPAS
ncbi:DUF421 domain-containing protein [Hymenobacter latericus]|uniref:DUF421 domain-containing protein n=1 Tax=Hymenobacter sp. YIM 151858-1 TaxID=2987688 RepID=UPI002227C14C|nr:YetF domain-containing protein [Hymenobacter sp. YIM 151858-1]UYZ59351.1 DUF421 domain-containing protein [Hymenobacter sp. YIM 151858-1]